MELKEKWDLILKGADAEAKALIPCRQEYQVHRSARINLAMIIAGLTSANKTEREEAKTIVRALVKLGKEAAE